MSKTIKLEDSVYTELDDFRVKDETFSQAVQRLLSGYKQTRETPKQLSEKPRGDKRRE